MPIELSIPLNSRVSSVSSGAAKNYTISDEKLQKFINTPTAAKLDELTTEIVTHINEHNSFRLEKITVAKPLIRAFIKKALKKPQEQQDYIVALIKALTSGIDDAQLGEKFSELSDCVALIKLLKASPYAQHQQLFKQVLSTDYLLSISATADDTDIIDLLQVLPVAQQQQYLEKLDADRLRIVLNDGFTLHGVLDSLVDSKSKRTLIDRLGIESVRHAILFQPEPEPDEESGAFPSPVAPINHQVQIIQQLVALLRAFKTDDDYNAILKQLGTDFLLTILSDTENLVYFFQQINTDKQQLMLNMLGAENLKKLLTPSHTQERSEAFENAQAISYNLIKLLSGLHPTNYTIVLNLLGQNWFRQNNFVQPLADSIAHYNYEVITALLPFIVTPENIKTLVNFAFSYDFERINLENEQPLVENAEATAIQPYNLCGDLPLVTLLWQSLTSDESKKWITANHALLNQFLVTSLQKWQAETTGFNKTFNQKYYLPALAHDGILAACVTNSSEFTNIIKHLHQDAQVTFLKALSAQHLKELISNWAMLGRGALAHLNPEAQNCLLKLLGQEHLSTLLVNKTEREQVTSYLHLNNQRRLTSMLRRQQLWQYAKIAGATLAITAGVGAFAYVAIPGAAGVITSWITSVSVGVQSLMNAVIVYSWHAAQYAMHLCYALLKTAWINVQAHQGLIFIGATLASIAGLAYLWRNKDFKLAVAAKESRVEQTLFKEHIIIDEAKTEPRSALRYYSDKNTKVNPEFAKAAKASLKKRRAAEQAEQAKDSRPIILPVPVPQQPHPVIGTVDGTRRSRALPVGSDNSSVTEALARHAALDRDRQHGDLNLQSQHPFSLGDVVGYGESTFGRGDASGMAPPPPRPFAHLEDDLSMRGGVDHHSEVYSREPALLRSDVRTASRHAPQPYSQSAPRSKELGLHRLHPASRGGAADGESLLDSDYRATTPSFPFDGVQDDKFTASVARGHYPQHARVPSGDATTFRPADYHSSATGPGAHPPLTKAWGELQQKPHMMLGAAAPLAARAGSSYGGAFCPPLGRPHGLSAPPRQEGPWAEVVDDDRSGPPIRS